MTVSPRTECIILGREGDSGTGVRYLTGEVFQLDMLLDEIRQAYDAFESTSTLRESDEKYKNLFAAVPDAVCIADENSRMIIDANESFFALYGYRRRDLRSIRYDDICADPSTELQALLNKSENPNTAFTSIHVTRNRTSIPVSITTRRFSFEHRGLICFVIRDTSKQHAIEHELSETNRSLGAIIEGIGDGFVAVDDRLDIIYCNRALIEQFGTPGATPIRMNLLETFPTLEKSDLPAWIRETKAHPRSVSFEQYLEDASGGRWFDIKLTPDGSNLSIFFHEISERKEMEMRLRQTQRLEAVGRLAGGVAHDFNNLLTVIIGYADLIHDSPDLSDEISESIDEIRKSAERATGLTHQLLAFSRKQMLQPRVLDPNELLRSIEKMLSRLIGEDIELIFDLEENVGSIKVDPLQLEQVILNLAINARDAMPDGGRLRIGTAAIEVHSGDPDLRFDIDAGNYIEITVSDTGCGMDAEVLERIFEPFFTTKTRDQGTGLGLSTAYGIIGQSDGFMFAASEPGAGSEFVVYLPLTRETRESDTSTPAIQRNHENTGTILVVEDEQPLREITRRVLDNLGYTVFDAPNGEEAIRIAVEQIHAGLDLIITDVVMPGISGREMVERIRAHHHNVKVLYISGYTDDEVLRRGISSNRDTFLPKPFSSQVLGRMVLDLLEAH